MTVSPEYSRGFRVLLIEDSPSDARFVREGLSELDIPTTLHVITDGARAVEFLTAHTGDASRPDLVILDLNLPGLRGHDVLSSIRAHEDLSGIPVAVMSSSKALEDIAESYRRHANCYVVKPIDLDEYLARIRELGRFWAKVATIPERPDAVERGIH